MLRREYYKDYFYPEDNIKMLSKYSGKTVLYFRADGPNACQDADTLTDIWDFYYGKADDNIISGLKQKGELYCLFDNMQEAQDAFNEWFPQKNTLLDDEMDYYIYVEMVNFSADLYAVNGV